MRQSIILLAVILIAVSAYTAYGLLTFKADEPYEFTFAEPTLPPDLLNLSKEKEKDPSLTPEMERQTEAAVSQLSEAVAIYQGYEKSAPQQAASTFSILNTAVLNGKLPAYLLSSLKSPSGARTFETLTFDTNKIADISKAGKGKDITCVYGTQGTADIVIADAGDNNIKCDAPRDLGKLDRMFLGGPGNDTLTSANGNTVINAGSGNDTITAGNGRLLLVLEDGWGNDTLTFDCKDSEVFPMDVPQGFPVPWVHKSINFIILSPRINRSDVEWDGLVLTNKSTGDTLSVNQNCFNVVGSTGSVIPAPATPVPAAP